jgi:cytochrome oxidase Cu insertion factor (SCO1/SenC/PrrC family)
LLPLGDDFHVSIFGNLLPACVSSVGMSRFARRVISAALFGVLTLSAMAQSKSYPKSQVASASGKIAPDFNLKNQDGKDFRLSEQRGGWVLLFFYRGYW